MTETRGDRFVITVDGRRYTSRLDASAALAHWMQSTRLPSMPTYGGHDFGVIGTIRGFDIKAEAIPGMGILNVTTRLAGVPRSSFTLSQREFLAGGVGLIQRIENRVTAIPTLLTHVREDLDNAERSKTEAAERVGQPFKHGQALDQAEKQLSIVAAALAAMQEENREIPKTPVQTKRRVPPSRPQTTATVEIPRL